MSVLSQDLDFQRHMSWIANVIYYGFPTSYIIQRQITGMIRHECGKDQWSFVIQIFYNQVMMATTGKFQSDNSNLTIMNLSSGSVYSLLAATVNEIMTGSTRSGIWNITNRKSWKLKHGPWRPMYRFFFILYF